MRGVSRNKVDDFEADDGEIELGGVGRALWRKKGWIIGSMLLAGVGAGAFVTIVKPRYTAEAKALIESQESYFTRPDKAAAEGAGVAPDAEAVSSQVQLVTSRDLAREAIKALGLKGNPEFDPAASGPGLLAPLTSLLGKSRDTRDMAPEERIFDAYFDRLNVFPIVKSRVLQIEFSSSDPDLSARAANTIAELYIGVQASAKRDSARVAASSLAGLIAELRTKVSEAERKAEEFRATNGLVLGANNVSMNGQQLSDINAQLSLARAAQADAQAKSRLIREMLRQGRLGEVPDVANNDLIRRLSEQRANMRAQIASEGRTLLPGHPRLKELSAQLSEIEGSLRSVAEKTARTLENDARIAGSRFENLQAALDQQKRTVGGASVDEVRARELDREARLYKEQLEASTAKYQEALARQEAASTPSDARIISRAVAPQLPTFPKKVPIVAFSLIAAFVLSAGAVIAGELMSGRAMQRSAGGRREERVEPSLAEARGGDKVAALDADTAAAVGEIATGDEAEHDEVEVREHPGSIAGLAEKLNAATTLDEKGATRLLVAGAVASAQAAETAVSLGRALAQGARVVLVEVNGGQGADPRGPAGLSDVIAGRADFSAAIHRDRESRLHLLPAGRGGPAFGDGVEIVIAALSHAYDYVILLAPAIDAGPEASDLASAAHFAVVVCVPEGGEIESAAACDALRRAGAREVIAVVEGETPATPPARTNRAA